ncbi:tRNA-2-methylthio-N6-dimethylallyladenosine synthase [Dyadobacter sp. BE34]|uniref:tRNA-2-methylthio-N(6)-dimethylallyladenosine synthase n=1 Tax=Dyadobacter fermentans TaxID=94254 RepID=A0ABU1R113_9BACT|nr:MULTISPECIES: tRNA (N6-isopentenyl adenosine(37)-C2)-methylthiotransferase MiaB [Dyadobacter]MDR6807096.1 tRNA-2-methylthio-N6-dimethylallyladenosine synthase [Dyadobacter fermentans]MDR7044837.1 tRNA-2-methylthio-N6-dimethylallyladenosine synthase [Dyadobacter sp. BE242]MDR7199427.1 tRNA-2-methylthio-N6-dimethylallyladenosine synthase [Dyadobacter sp. BE34]MDR7217387.1 tRNA-2-methylthio-N6-dimethylallyladenosine synthase [Dyadobacter sp. BE31]MDR7265319.1 tRNA-2-methylthio-N6-dimethylallyl
MEHRIADSLKILTEADKEACETVRVSENEPLSGKKRLFIESYGCQMNFSDSEIVASVMRDAGFATTSDVNNADLIFLNTCAIRDNAEQKVRNRLKQLNFIKKNKPGMLIGVLGCMAERLKTKFLEEEKMVDIVTGPDAYRDLPRLVDEAETGQKGVNVFLSREETYADISPIRLNSNGVTAFISIMRGCDNMCSFCVVPFTRGRERSRDPYSIVKEAEDLFRDGYREVTLLGQNVDSYKWKPEANAEGEIPSETVVNFANLLEMVAKVSPELRIRFSTSHPKDITDEVLYTMKRYDNICKYIHLPAQSGNTRVLELMNRTYTREWYMERIDAIRRILGDECGISQDMIAGFCTETEEEHRDTLSLMEYAKFDFGFMFAYSERPGTLAAKKFKDDIPEEVKKRRLAEIIEVQQRLSLARNQQLVGTVQRVLIEGPSKRSDDDLSGRNDQNKKVVFPRENFEKGQYVDVLITECTTVTLLGHVVQPEPVLG